MPNSIEFRLKELKVIRPLTHYTLYEKPTNIVNYVDRYLLIFEGIFIIMSMRDEQGITSKLEYQTNEYLSKKENPIKYLTKIKGAMKIIISRIPNRIPFLN
jgi:hypothetical protein